MPISLHCATPGCRKPLRVKDELAGKRFKCPACGQTMFTPARQGELPPAPGPEPQTGQQSPPASQALPKGDPSSQTRPAAPPTEANKVTEDRNDFWRATWTAWRSGALSAISAGYAQAAKGGFDDFMKTSADAKNLAL